MKTFRLRDPEPELPDRQPVYTLDYAGELNEAQHQAVFHGKGRALVIAGAGTGKTRTLIWRVARLIESGVPASGIVLLTFTRRAATEMLRRASTILDDRCREVRGGTFHAYCTTLLRRHGHAVGLAEHFTIADSADSEEIMRVVRQQVGVKGLGRRFPSAGTLRNLESMRVNRLLTIQEAIESYIPQFAPLQPQIEQALTLYGEFKRTHDILDYDDLLVRTAHLLHTQEAIRVKVASENHHVLIDEYQDTNRLQAGLADQFSSEHGNLMAVGDDAQSIYSFRGADFENIMAFTDHYRDATRITLERNYRSVQPVLDLANALLARMSRRHEKQLQAERGEGDLPGLVKAATVQEQSRFVCQLILALREQGHELKDVGVLFRNGRDSYDLELELARANLPFVKWGGQKFTDAAHVRDVLAYLRVLVNASDAVAWSRLLMLLEGVGEKTAGRIFEQVRGGRDLVDLGAEAGQGREGVEGLSKVLASCRTLGEAQVPAVLERVVAHYADICARTYDDAPKRLQDLEAFIALSAGFRDLSDLLEQAALEPVERSAVATVPAGSAPDEPPLVLSTIHSAKGMEWKTVFIIQCLDGIIPSGYSVDDPDRLDEELRLFYVAVTRARDRLLITYPVLQGGYREESFSNPSRFIRQADEGLLEPWILTRE